MLKFLSDLKLIFKSPLLIDRDKKSTIIFKYFVYIFILFFINTTISFIIHKVFNTQRPYGGNLNKKTFLKSVIFIPIIEEFVFRAIQKRKKQSIILFISGILSFFLLLYSKKINIYLHIILFLFFLIFWFIYFFKFHKKKINPYTKKQSIYIIYLSSIIFGLMHINTFKTINLQIIFPLILVTLPKVFDGFLLSLLRFKFGLFYSVLFHVLINLIPFMIFQFR